MSLNVECPRCGRRLSVAESAGGEQVICPRCLSDVAIPAGREDFQADRPEARERGLSCPHCGRAVEPLWLTCPWCEEPLRGGIDRRYGRPDLDVRRDRKRTGVFVILLAVLGLIGLAICGFGAFAELGNGDYVPMIYLAVPLLFLAGLTALIVFLRSGGNMGPDAFRRIVVGTLAMAGGLVVLTMCFVGALFVYVLAVCGPLRGHF